MCMCGISSIVDRDKDNKCVYTAVQSQKALHSSIEGRGSIFIPWRLSRRLHHAAYVALCQTEYSELHAADTQFQRQKYTVEKKTQQCLMYWI